MATITITGNVSGIKDEEVPYLVELVKTSALGLMGLGLGTKNLTVVWLAEKDNVETSIIVKTRGILKNVSSQKEADNLTQHLRERVSQFLELFYPSRAIVFEPDQKS